jgi:penicillin-binding protein 2
LTIVKGTYYRNLSEGNRIREVIIEPQRGKITDRNGIILADSTPANVDESGPRLTSRRIYNDPEDFAQVLGYRLNADQHDFDQDPCLNKLKLGDKVGKKGVEKLFECDLRGSHGKKLIEVDAKGNYVRTLSVLPPEDGKTVQLSIDAELQRKAMDLTKSIGKNAVVIGLKPATGEVITLTSLPTFNPQDFEDQNSKMISQYFTDKNKPLFNRALEGTYPPGSTFKMVVASAALEEKAIDSRTQFDDNGFITAGGIRFGNWYYLEYGKVEGQVDVIKALQRSNDTFFYQVGDKVGPVKIKLYAEKFGFSRRTGIGLDESEGTIPSPFWKEDVLKEKWYTGDTYNFSIGQGNMLATPIQVAQYTTAFANNGTICQPTLLKSDGSNTNCKKIGFSEDTLTTVRQGMKEACSPGGTGYPFFNFGSGYSASDSAELVYSSDSARFVPKNTKLSDDFKKKPFKRIEVGCKTGTAEVHDQSSAPHAWFTVFAPYDNPEVEFTVLVEEAGQGSDIAAPIAKEIMKLYFDRQD